MNKRTWGLICLAVSMLMSCREGQNVKNDGKVDSLVTRTQGEVWGFMPAGVYPSQNEIKFLTGQIYPVGASQQGQGSDPQWQTILKSAKGDGQQIYLTESFDRAGGEAIINNEKQQTTTINALLSRLKERSASGLVVNFGLVKAEDATKYVKFIKKLADKLHSEKLGLAVVTPPENWLHDNDLVALSEASDHLLFDFSIGYNARTGETSGNPYGQGDGSIVVAMGHILNAPIAIRKVMMILPSDDWNFSNHCNYALNVGLAGVVVKYSGQKTDQMLNDTLKARFQYVDTIRVKR